MEVPFFIVIYIYMLQLLDLQFVYIIWMEIYKWENKTRQTNMGWEKNKQRQLKKYKRVRTQKNVIFNFSKKGACFVLKFNLHQEQTGKDKKRHDVNREKFNLHRKKCVYLPFQLESNKENHKSQFYSWSTSISAQLYTMLGMLRPKSLDIYPKWNNVGPKEDTHMKKGARIEVTNWEGTNKLHESIENKAIYVHHRL